ncbi:MAG TPA: transposase, partial [Candidatus Paceibacterota bacterium]|nr:transposase [Candidatus Paceibacterota bacterium]
MNRKFNFSVGEFYHVYNRGVEKRIIFTCDEDYYRFIGLLYLANSEESFSFRDIAKGESSGQSLFDYKRGESLVDIGSYCLMPNHFHLLLKEKKEGGISLFVSKVCTGYSMYFNKKYEHVGTLFQGPFGATYLDSDNYLKYIYSYIHLNPVKLINSDWRETGISNLPKTKDFLANYKYSSYLDYLGISRSEGKILNKKVLNGLWNLGQQFP